jgi:uncharacterized membrane protein
MRSAPCTIVSFTLSLATFLAVFTCFTQGAQAALVFCNRTQQPLEAAIGYRGTLGDQAEDWISEGWWRIEPGQCARVYNEPLKERFYFDYAVALSSPGRNKAPYSWTGKYPFCADTKAFRVEGDGDCESRGYQTKSFQQIDVGPNAHDYKLDFKDVN